jgi:hypothetical protein
MLISNPALSIPNPNPQSSIRIVLLILFSDRVLKYLDNRGTGD